MAAWHSAQALKGRLEGFREEGASVLSDKSAGVCVRLFGSLSGSSRWVAQVWAAMEERDLKAAGCCEFGEALWGVLGQVLRDLLRTAWSAWRNLHQVPTAPGRRPTF